MSGIYISAFKLICLNFGSKLRTKLKEIPVCNYCGWNWHYTIYIFYTR